MKRLYLLIFLFTPFQIFSQSWTRVASVPVRHIVAMAAYHDSLLAASDGSDIYKSTDGGLTWNPFPVSGSTVNIMSIAVLDDTIYAGTNSNGIFRSADFGLTWVNSGSGLLTVTGIAKQGNQLYASTQGAGVYKYDRASANWIPCNDSLPNYSLSVNSIIGTDTSLFIAAGANGTYYRFDFASNSWVEGYYDGIMHPGLQIDHLIHQSDTLFALAANRIIRSDDNGLTWSNDVTGAHTGYARTLFVGAVNHYTVSNIPFGGTWIQHRNRNAASGTSWAVNEEFLSTGLTYDILEYGNKLFLARDSGLFVKNLLTGIQPVPGNVRSKIFADPSDGTIHVSSYRAVKNISVITNAGQVVFASSPAKKSFVVYPQLQPGLYLVRLLFADGTSEVNKIVF